MFDCLSKRRTKYLATRKLETGFNAYFTVVRLISVLFLFFVSGDCFVSHRRDTKFCTKKNV